MIVRWSNPAGTIPDPLKEIVERAIQRIHLVIQSVSVQKAAHGYQQVSLVIPIGKMGE
jgi:hypothetical protein